MTQDKDNRVILAPHPYVWCDKTKDVCFWPECWSHACVASSEETVADGEVTNTKERLE